MLAQERHIAILVELRRYGAVHVDRLAAAFGVAPMTVRRDLAALAENRLLQRVRGGAVLPAYVGSSEPRMPRAGGSTVGMLVPSLDYYYPDIVRAAQAVAGTYGIRILLRRSGYDSGPADQRQIEQLLGAAVRGMLLTPSSQPDECEAVLDWVSGLDTPVVLVERQPASTRARWARLDSVSTDHQLGAALAVDHLMSLGHRVIGLLTPPYSPTSEALRVGFWGAVRRAGLGRRRVVLAEIDGTVPSAAAASLALEGVLSSGVTALLVHADMQAADIAQAAREINVDVPQSLSIISYDDEFASVFDPPLTAVRPPRSALGNTSMELLHARLSRGQNRPTQRIRLVPQLIPRSSTAKPGRRRRGVPSRSGRQ